MMLTSRIRRHSSGVASMPRSTKMAALLTRTSIVPKVATASWDIRATLDSSATSVAMKMPAPLPC